MHVHDKTLINSLLTLSLIWGFFFHHFPNGADFSTFISRNDNENFSACI